MSWEEILRRIIENAGNVRPGDSQSLRGRDNCRAVHSYRKPVVDTVNDQTDWLCVNNNCQSRSVTDRVGIDVA